MKKNKTSPSETNEDDIIIEALTIIKTAILNADTDGVIKGYELIIGKKLIWGGNKPKSRLDKIRENFKDEDEDEEEGGAAVGVDKPKPPEDDDGDIPVHLDFENENLIIKKQKRNPRKLSPLGNRQILVIEDIADPEQKKINDELMKKGHRSKRPEFKGRRPVKLDEGVNYSDANTPPPKIEE